MKYNKGYNGARRKALRTLKRMQMLFDDGATYNELWTVYEPMYLAAGSIPRNDICQITLGKCIEMLHKTAYQEYEAEVVAEYWASR